MIIELISADAPTLDKFLLRVSDEKASQLIDRQDQKIIAFDRENGTASETEVSFWSNLGRILGFSKVPLCYLVDIYQGQTVKSNHSYRILSERYGIMELNVIFTVGALGGREIRLVEKLVKRNDPAKTLKEFLSAWTQDAIQTFEENIFRDFALFQGHLASTLKQKGESIGIQLSVSVNTKSTKIDPEAKLTFEADDIRLQPKGYSDFIFIGFDTTLVSDAASHVYSTIGEQLKEELKKLLISWIQEYIQSEISFNKLTETLHGKLREDLIKFWNERLLARNKGWKVSELRFRFADILPDSFRFEQLEVEVALKEGSIPLINTITLNLDDPQKFKNARIDNIENWLKEKLRQTTQSVLTGVAFAELAARIEDFQSIIKNDLDKEARQIGYKVKYLLTSGPISKIKHSFNFEFDEDEQDYDTDSNDRVKLNIIVNGKILNYNHENLKRILTPNMDLAKEMKKEAKREVRKFILRCKPEQYYLDFDTVVGPELDTRLRDMLYRQFNVSRDVDIVLRWQGSALIERLRNLMRGFFYSTVRDRQGKLEFSIKFNVEGVHKQQWGRFAALGFEDSDEEKRVLAEEIRVAVENRMRQEFEGISLPVSTRLTDFVKAFAIESIKPVVENTGLIIRINNVEQKKNEYADTLATIRGDYGILSLKETLEQIKLLDAQISKTEQSGLLPQKVKELKEKKAELQREVMGADFNENQLRTPSDEELANKWLKNGGDLQIDDGQ